MTIRYSFDQATRVSAALSEIIEKLASDPDRESPPTLEDVRRILRRRESLGTPDAELMHPQDETSPLAELNRLIEEYGGDALGNEFVVAKASEGLSRVIQAVVDDITKPRSPTLDAVRTAMLGGLTARLVGDGAIDEDDDIALQGEIEELIRRYGGNTLAEMFVRFE